MNERSELSENELARAIEHGKVARDSLQPTSDAFKCLDALLISAKRSQELQQKLDEWSNKELLGETERCRLQALEQSSREKDELIEEFSTNTEAMSLRLWSCCRDGEHSTERPYCIPGKRLINTLHLAHSKGYGQQKEK